MSLVRIIPAIIIPWLAYHIIAFAGGAGMHDNPDSIFDKIAFIVPLVNNNSWAVRLGDIVITLTIFAGFVEVFKSSSVRESEFIDYGLAAILLVLAIVQFIVYPLAQTSVFFFIIFALFCDLFVSFAVGLRTSRRNIGIESDRL